jgi:Ni/Co efflux regulator RcnB
MITPKGRFLPIALLSLALLAGLPALAEKPEGAQQRGGKPDKHEKHGKHEKHAPSHRDDRHDTRPRVATAPSVSVNIQIGGYFGEPQRRIAHEYYEPRFKAGKCPPGLAKKHNGCMPPGQAKKWRMGYPLPHDVVYYPVPSGVSVQIGVPPAGYRYVRVAADILLIAVGTGIVVDAIEDLGRL